MSIIDPNANQPLIMDLPPAFGGCRCSCHRLGGFHFVACCCPSEDDLIREKIRIFNEDADQFEEEIKNAK